MYEQLKKLREDALKEKQLREQENLSEYERRIPQVLSDFEDAILKKLEFDIRREPENRQYNLWLEPREHSVGIGHRNYFNEDIARRLQAHLRAKGLPVKIVYTGPRIHGKVSERLHCTLEF